MTPPGRPRVARHDNAILDAALELFIDRGAAGLSIEEVARRAQVGRPTVYRRWSTKEDLLVAALEHARTGTVDLPTPESTLDDVVDYIAALLSRARFRALMTRVVGAALDYPQLIAAYQDHQLRSRLDALEAIVRREIAEGTLPPGLDPQTVQDLLASSIGLVLLEPGPITADGIARRLQTLLGYVRQRQR